MCLQLPPNTKLVDEGDDTGAQAMAKLAELFEEGGMKDVNTDRLTARIPIVMFSCPRPMASEDQDPMMECDLSMQNPLACLNTSLLLTYSQIHPVTRVLASIIKRWAKSRDINSPSDHTLSTYGYILMLLHFLTFHRKTGSGLVTAIDNRDDRSSWTPLLPNLQWMDPSWPESQPGTPYRELATQPKQLMPHPLDHSDFVVNTYFYRLKDQNTLTQLQQRFPGQDVSIAILLASFFRYYAHEFDYKRSVVSLNSTSTKIVEREAKAETDGWRVFRNGLSIEDPFETFYDVAHVVKGSNYHRIRNEFALAYTKIVNAAAGSCDKDLIDWICEPYVKPPED
jgi:terminal uridylyltransferase